MIDIFQGTGEPVTEQGFAAAAEKLGVKADLPSLWSILAVETRGFGYQADKRPKILFERHVFQARTRGRFTATHPDISFPEPGGYGKSAEQYGRLKRAMLLDRQAALESASWGLGQVMGFNAAAIGYRDVDAMIEAFKEGEDAQLEGCAKFITATPALHRAFMAHQWPKVAFFYNGKSFRENRYDEKLAASYAEFLGGAPDIAIRADQACLAYLGFDPSGIDGRYGPGTARAVRAFQASINREKGGAPLPVTGKLDAATRAALRSRAIG